MFGSFVLFIMASFLTSVQPNDGLKSFPTQLSYTTTFHEEENDPAIIAKVTQCRSKFWKHESSLWEFLEKSPEKWVRNSWRTPRIPRGTIARTSHAITAEIPPKTPAVIPLDISSKILDVISSQISARIIPEVFLWISHQFLEILSKFFLGLLQQCFKNEFLVQSTRNPRGILRELPRVFTGEFPVGIAWKILAFPPKMWSILWYLKEFLLWSLQKLLLAAPLQISPRFPSWTTLGMPAEIPVEVCSTISTGIFRRIPPEISIGISTRIQLGFFQEFLMWFLQRISQGFL